MSAISSSSLNPNAAVYIYNSQSPVITAKASYANIVSSVIGNPLLQNQGGKSQKTSTHEVDKHKQSLRKQVKQVQVLNTEVVGFNDQHQKLFTQPDPAVKVKLFAKWVHIAEKCKEASDEILKKTIEINDRLNKSFQVEWTILCLYIIYVMCVTLY